ncbi:MAG: sugar transferase, partial [Nocardioides sp.]|nr:sugar transferase [Nocardioides sp.]
MEALAEATTLRLVEETVTTARGRRPSARLAASACDALVLAAIVLVLRGSTHAVVDAGAWGLATLVMAPRTLPGAESLRATVTGVFRAAMLVGMLTFAIGALVDLEQRMLALVTLIGFMTALMIRIVAFVLRTRPRTPLRVVVVDAGLDHRGTLERTRGLGAGAVEPAAVCLPAELPGAILEHQPQAVLVVPGPELAGREIQRLAWTTESYNVPLLVNTRMQDVTPHRTASMRLGSLTLLYVDEAHRARVGRLVKFVWEWLAAALALVLLSPLFLVLAVLIKLDSRGPVFFRQVRVG